MNSREASLLAILSQNASAPCVALERGSRLKSGNVRLVLPCKSLLAPKDSLDHQQITLVPTKPEYRLGKSVVVNESFIAYAVRGTISSNDEVER